MAAASWDACAPTQRCGEDGDQECFPAWRLAALPPAPDGATTLASPEGGSAAGANADALLGMVVLVLLTEAEQPKWWLDLARRPPP